MANTGKKHRDDDEVDVDIDSFPTFNEALSAASNGSPFAKERVRRIDIRFGADGSGWYRVWQGRDRDPAAGTIPRS